ncbi:MAG TPA: IS30 family transposase [Mycobacterium sp.]|nr:IS30 family transposase [Mycobacterium sp.]
MAPMQLSEPSGRYLSFGERETIALELAAGTSQAQIARMLSRHRSTISREVRRNMGVRRPRCYRPSVAQDKADRRARRPKQGKIAAHPPLQVAVQAGLNRKLSPEQISAELRVEFADDAQMQVSHESIYRSLFVQGRGELRRELTRNLRTGRAVRRPRQRGETRGRIPNMVMISERPAEADDRAVPGHWEGDLIVGAKSRSAIGTLVERSTRFVILLHLPDDHSAETVRDAVVDAMRELPDHLRRSLTWDQGVEMARHAEITLAADLPVYFCDPASPWQRGSNENTNGLLRQYFAKGSDLSVFPKGYLDYVAAELNGRPRKTLDWNTPARALLQLLSTPPDGRVATTA